MPKWDEEACKRLGYAAVSYLCNCYHRAWKHHRESEKKEIEFCLLYPHNVERLTFEEQNGEQILKLLQKACIEKYGKFTTRKRGKKKCRKNK